MEVSVDDREPLSGEVVDAGCPTAEHDRGERERDDHAHGDKGEMGVEQDKSDAHAHEGANTHKGGQKTVLDERLELVDVGGHPGHDPARHLTFVVVERQALQLSPDGDAQRHHDPLGRAARDKGRADLVEQVGDCDREIDP